MRFKPLIIHIDFSVSITFSTDSSLIDVRWAQCKLRASVQISFLYMYSDRRESAESVVTLVFQKELTFPVKIAEYWEVPKNCEKRAFQWNYSSSFPFHFEALKWERTRIVPLKGSFFAVFRHLSVFCDFDREGKLFLKNQSHHWIQRTLFYRNTCKEKKSGHLLEVCIGPTLLNYILILQVRLLRTRRIQ